MSFCPHPRLSLKNYGDSSPISVAIKDIEEMLWDEYGIEMKKRKEWLHRSNQQGNKDV